MLQGVTAHRPCEHKKQLLSMRLHSSHGTAVAAAATLVLLVSVVPGASGAGLAANNTKSILYLKSTLNVSTGRPRVPCCTPADGRPAAPAFS
jgi:hypothetical protein